MRLEQDGVVARPPFVTRVRVHGFRSLDSCDVRLGPLTVLVGPNAAGKSNFLDAVAFLVDALCTSLKSAVSVRGGLDALLFRDSAGSTARSFGIRLDFGGAGDFYALEVGRDESGHLAVVREEGVFGSFRLNRSADVAELTPNVLNIRGIDADQPAAPILESIKFAPPTRTYRELAAELRAAKFYDLNTPTLRALDETPAEARDSALGASGEHLGHVLGLLAARNPAVKETVDGYVSLMIDNALGVDRKDEGRYTTVSARFRTGDGGSEVFERESLSEGTLRLAGVLTALYQPDVLTGSIPFVSIEEPEKAIHPPSLGALYEALAAGSQLTQIIVTTQSADLLDSEAADPAHLLVAVNTGGATRIGPLDAAGRSLVEDKTMTLAELMRTGLMRPEVTPEP
ncbi:AAA family ATPase [Actinocorallia lasiicapitis]